MEGMNNTEKQTVEGHTGMPTHTEFRLKMDEDK